MSSGLIVFQAAPPSGQYGHSWMRAAVRFHHDAEHTSSEPHEELKRYIDSPLEDVANVVAWWGVSDR
jgi:2-polyprenyl-6-methoxyphenol hydroxylase-like FAD-dependent oxidoreductase